VRKLKGREEKVIIVVIIKSTKIRQDKSRNERKSKLSRKCHSLKIFKGSKKSTVGETLSPSDCLSIGLEKLRKENTCISF